MIDGHRVSGHLAILVLLGRKQEKAFPAGEAGAGVGAEVGAGVGAGAGKGTIGTGVETGAPSSDHIDADEGACVDYVLCFRTPP